MEVENFLKYNSVRCQNGLYKVSVRLFKESLIDDYWYEARYQNDYYIRFRYSFLNKRINAKWHSVYRRLFKKIDYNSLFSMACEYILNFLSGKEYIYINFDNYKKHKDDITKMVFMLDVDFLHKVITSLDHTYQRPDKRVDVKYTSNFGNIMPLEAELDSLDGKSLCEVIGECDVVLPYSNDDDDIDKCCEIISEGNLTKHQQNILKAFVINDYNYSETARYTGTDVSNTYKTMSRIRAKYGVYNEPKPDPDLQTYDNLQTTQDILDWIKANKNNSRLFRIFNNIDTSLKIEYRRMENGAEHNEENINKYLAKVDENINKYLRRECRRCI